MSRVDNDDRRHWTPAQWREFLEGRDVAALERRERWLRGQLREVHDYTDSPERANDLAERRAINLEILRRLAGGRPAR